MKRKVKKEVERGEALRSNLTKPLKSKKSQKKQKKKNLHELHNDVQTFESNIDLMGEQKRDNHKTFILKLKEASPKKENTTSKIPKIRRTAVTEDVEENYMIVPWGSRDEWDTVCLDFHSKNYEKVVAKIGVWQNRVPSLPVGVEATLFLLEAIIYDQKFLSRHFPPATGLMLTHSQVYTEDQTRSLYSLAVIRYLNHVSHLAAQSVGESSTRPTRELAALVDTPDWIVMLRNEISHGSTVPSIEILRMAGNFILHWLKAKYWKLPQETVQEENPDGDDSLLVITTGQDDETGDNPSVKIDQLLAAYVAARIYKLRHIYTIDDEDIVKHITVHTLRIKTKTAMISLRKRLRKYLQNHPSVFCSMLSESLIPTPEFYESFASILPKNKGELDEETYIYEKFYGVWLPILKMLQNKGKILAILTNLCESLISQENEKMKTVTALWIDKILEVIEESGKKYTNALTRLLGTVVKHPAECMLLFLERLFRLTEPRIGYEAVQKLSLLVSISLDSVEDTRRKKRKKSYNVTLFSLNDIEGNGNEIITNEENVAGHSDLQSLGCFNNWQLDHRGEDFWRNVPIGAVLSS